MRIGVWGIVSVVFLALAPAAWAGQRYAAPAGTGAECAQEKPCSLSEAVNGAKAGDEVILGAGTYPVAFPGISAPPGATNVQIHGDPSGPMPRLTAAFGGFAIVLSQTGDSLSYVEIENDANNGDGVLCFGSRLERVRVRTVGTNGIGALVYSDCAIRNSLFRVEGGGSTALRSSSAGSGGKTTASARNVTAIASGSGSSGMATEYNDPTPGSFTLELENSIAQGTAQDLKPQAGANGPGNIAVTHSNFDTSTPVGEAKVIDGGGNQTAPPIYVDAENGDFREAAGSPTIDAGIADQLGPFDLAGNTRILGTAPDIGAYEFLPPAAVQPAAAGTLQSLSLSPSAFAPAKTGEAILSAKKKKAPVGTTVTYSLSAAATVTFSLERRLPGRKVGKRCVKQTRANRTKKRCSRFKPLKGSFTHSGQTGQNRFKFSGRTAGKGLTPGSYRLVGKTGSVSKTASFKIVK